MTKVIPTGSLPQGLAVSADGRKLWVANSGSKEAAIGVIDLRTLTVLPSLPAPNFPSDIEEGLDHRLYVTPFGQSYPDYGIMQVNADTGAFEGYFGDFFVYHRGFVEVSSDRRTWFFGNRGLSASNLFKFDISGRTATLLQKVSFSGGNGTGLSVSHNSRFLVYPNAGGNGSGYRTFEIPTSDIRSVNGSFIVGASPRAATFSNDDTLLYHGTSSQSAVKIFNTKTFRLLREISLGDSPNGGGGYDTPEVVVDRSGRWLFVATNNYASEPEGDLRVFDTGRDDPLPPPQLANLSTRLNVGKDDNALIGGVIITGNEPKKLMVRAIGPSFE